MKNFKLLAVMLVFFIAGFYLISSRNTVPENKMDQTNNAEKMVVETQKVDESDRYVEYNSNTFDQLTAKRKVLFFYASWCPTCRPVDAELKANMDKLPADTLVIRVNYNDQDTDRQEKDLAKKYGITYQHTFVQIDANGNEITKWNGGGLTELLENVKPQ
jgi:thioredoxin 1